MLIIDCLLISFLLIGWGFIFAHILKADLAIGIFNATAFSSLVLFFGFIAGHPRIVAWLILSLGAISFVYFFMKTILNQKEERFHKDILTIICYLLLGGIGFFIAFGMKFGSIDDYSFWGTMSKYLYVFHELPKNNQYISSNYLTYTPLLASFHYLLYTLGGHYSQCLGYYAQALFLISAMMIFFNPKDMVRSITYLSFWYLLLTLAYGLALARMEVDAYVASYFFIVSWLIYQKKHEVFHLVCIPILALSIIKEIGLLFSIATVFLMLLEKRRLKLWIQCLILLFFILLTKLIWKWHVGHLGFQSFSHAITLKGALSALNPLNDDYQMARGLYLKEVFLANFDRVLKLPYLLFYLVLFGLFFWICKQRVEDLVRIKKIMAVFLVLALSYLLMLYCLQAIVFEVGYHYHRILDFTRYYNMLFLPWLSLIFFIALDKKKSQISESSFSPTSQLLVAVALIALMLGKIERTVKFYQAHDIYYAQEIIKKETRHFNKIYTICIINAPNPSYGVMFPLTYFFMPNRVMLVTNPREASCDLSLEWGKKKKPILV